MSHEKAHEKDHFFAIEVSQEPTTTRQHTQAVLSFFRDELKTARKVASVFGPFGVFEIALETAPFIALFVLHCPVLIAGGYIKRFVAPELIV